MKHKAIKKTVVVFIVIMMMTSSLTFVMAALNLKDYPKPFLENGKFEGELIIGDQASIVDSISALDIAANLQFPIVIDQLEKDTTVKGEIWKVGTQTKVWELSENLKNGANRESIASIVGKSFIDQNELPTILNSGKVKTKDGTISYKQRLHFKDDSTGYVQYIENSDDITSDFLYFPRGKEVALYEVDFTTPLRSDISNEILKDIEGSELTMLGKKYVIVQARRSVKDQIALTLMGGSIKDNLKEGESKAYLLNGKKQDVVLEFVSSAEVRFLVNGEQIRLGKGEVKKLSDGYMIGVSEILYQGFAGGLRMATFYLGAEKLELKDTNIQDTSSSHQAKVNTKTVDNVDIIIEGTDENSRIKIYAIKASMVADDSYYVPAGGRLSDSLKQPDFLLTRNWDIIYQGLESLNRQQIAIKASRSDDYTLEFINREGHNTKLPLIHATGDNNIKLGNSNNALVVQENQTIKKGDYFVLSDESNRPGQRSSYVLRYRGADKIGEETATIAFDELGSGRRLERTIKMSGSQLGEIKLAGKTFSIYNVTSANSKDFDIIIDMNGDNEIKSNIIVLNTQYGASISIEQDSESKATVLINTPNINHYNSLTPTPFIFNVEASKGEVRLNLDPTQNHKFLTPRNDKRNQYAYSSYGALARRTLPANGPQEVYIEYPQIQRVPFVYISSSNASITNPQKSTEEIKVQTIKSIKIKFPSEVSEIGSISSILVGGPCANAMTSQLLGNPEDCTLGFEPGVGRIELHESAGKSVLLVAGYNAADTKIAAQVIANYPHYKDNLNGEAVEVRIVNNVLKVTQSTLKAAKWRT